MELSLSLIKSKIHIIRGIKVILDFDLAGFYETETGNLKRQVRRNMDRFPDDFMFALTRDEFNDLRCQFGASRWGGTRYLPYAFTVHGVVMSSNVLQSKKAIDTSIKIVRAFNAMSEVLQNIPQPADDIRELYGEMKQLKQYIEEIFTDQNDINEDTRIQLELFHRTLADLQSKTKWLDNPGKPHWN